jgi:hypothetical protein
LIAAHGHRSSNTPGRLSRPYFGNINLIASQEVADGNDAFLRPLHRLHFYSKAF